MYLRYIFHLDYEIELIIFDIILHHTKKAVILLPLLEKKIYQNEYSMREKLKLV